MKNEIWDNPDECILECPLCRSKTIKINYGVKCRYNKENNTFNIYKDNKVLTLGINLYN